MKNSNTRIFAYLWGQKTPPTYRKQDLIALKKNTFDHSLRLFKYFLSVEIHSNLHFLEKHPCRQIIEKDFQQQARFPKIQMGHGIQIGIRNA